MQKAIMIKLKGKKVFLDQSNLPLLIEFVNTFSADLNFVELSDSVKLTPMNKFIRKFISLGFEPKIQKALKKPKQKTNSQINKEISEVKTYILMNQCKPTLLELKEKFSHLDYSDGFYLKLMFQADKIFQQEKLFWVKNIK